MIRIRARRITPFLLLLAMPAIAIAQQPASSAGLSSADPVVGTFTDGQLTVRLEGSAGRYTGYGELGGVVYPVELSGRADSLRGTYLSDGQHQPVDARLSGDVLEIRADASFFRLRRVIAPEGPAPDSPPDAGALWQAGREWIAQ